LERGVVVGSIPSGGESMKPWSAVTTTVASGPGLRQEGRKDASTPHHQIGLAAVDAMLMRNGIEIGVIA
jgi:hypothetical protein